MLRIMGLQKASAALAAFCAVCALISTPASAGGTVRDFGTDKKTVTVAYVCNHSHDDDYVTMKGRIIRYLGGVYYMFSDDTGEIMVELDADKDWSFIRKDEMVLLYGKVDREFFSTEVSVYRAESLEHKSRPVRMRPASAAAANGMH